MATPRPVEASASIIGFVYQADTGVHAAIVAGNLLRTIAVLGRDCRHLCE